MITQYSNLFERNDAAVADYQYQGGTDHYTEIQSRAKLAGWRRRRARAPERKKGGGNGTGTEQQSLGKTEEDREHEG